MGDSYVYLTAGNVAQAREAAKGVAKASIYHRELLVACTQAQRQEIWIGLCGRQNRR